MADRERLVRMPDGRTLVRTVFATAAMVLLPLLGGLPGVFGALLLGWILASALYPLGGLVTLLPVAGAAIGCACTLPQGLGWLALPWAALGAAGVLIPAATWQKRAGIWAAAGMAFVCTALGALSVRYGGAPLAAGLSQELADTISALAERDAVLISAYQAGLAQLDKAYAAMPAVRIGDVVLMMPAVRMQLLYSLQTNMEYILAASMPGLIVSYAAMTTLMCTVLPDEMLRRHGLAKQPLPAIETWRLPRRLPGGIIVLCLLGFLPSLTNHDMLESLGRLCSSAVDWVFMFTGAGLLAYLMKQRGVSRMMRMIAPLVLAVAIPQTLVILGIVDMFVPLRPRSDADSFRRK